MKKEFSIYLDLVRFAAAFVVMMFHSNFRLLTWEPLPFFDLANSRAAVIIFFVLSGYVISYITTARESDPVDYWASRLSRFYSVALPIVLLCPLLDAVGSRLGPAFYEGRMASDYAWLRMLTSLTYTNEIWKLSIQSFSNVPYWSLCYEMWYYALFAVVAFVQGRARVWLVALILLFVGPKIIVMAPIWILGVVLHRYSGFERLAKWQSLLLFLGSWPLYALFYYYEVSAWGGKVLLALVGKELHAEAVFSRYFISDYLLALIVAANFIGFRGIGDYFARPLRLCERPIRWISSFTFSLYILHQPLLQFYSALINGDNLGRMFYLQVMCATIVTVIVIGTLTEQKRGALRRLIRAGLRKLTESRPWKRGVTPVLAPRQAGG